MQDVDKHITNFNYIRLMYRILEDMEDKFIVMACLQLGYSQEDVAIMMDISQEAVSKRLKKSRAMLRMSQEEVIF